MTPTTAARNNREPILLFVSSTLFVIVLPLDCIPAVSHLPDIVDEPVN